MSSRAAHSGDRPAKTSQRVPARPPRPSTAHLGTPASILALQRAVGNQAVQRYFDLGQASQAGLDVVAAEGTRFPGHDQNEQNPDFLTPQGGVNRRERQDVPDLAVSDDGRMAIESAAVNGNREVEAFLAEPDVVAAANETLHAQDSALDLLPVDGQTVRVPELDGPNRHTLTKVIGRQAPKQNQPDDAPPPSSGAQLFAPERCNEIAQEIIGKSGLVVKLSTGDTSIYDSQVWDEVMVKFLAGYVAEAAKDPANLRPTKRETYVEIATQKAWQPLQFETVFITPTEKRVTFTAYKGKREALERRVLALAGDVTFKEYFLHGEWTWLSGLLSWGRYQKTFVVKNRPAPADDIVQAAIEPLRDDFIDFDLQTAQGNPARDNEATLANMDGALEALRETIRSSPEILSEAERLLGMNDHANPDVGEAFMIMHKGERREDQNFPYHFAAVVARSGEDAVTLENYARARHENTGGTSNRMYFQMYGPKREVTVGDGQVTHDTEGPAEEREARERAAGSFHGRWKGLFSEPQTVTVKKGTDESE